MDDGRRLVRDFAYFRAVAEPLQVGRKTRDVMLRNNRNGDLLGTVRWYGPWRQYCFFPAGQTVWSAGCLRDVGELLAMLKDWPLAVPPTDGQVGGRP